MITILFTQLRHNAITRVLQKSAIISMALSALLLLLSSCSDPQPVKQTEVFQKRLLEQLITASPGTVIEIPEGKFSINRGLSLKISGVTIKGAGMNKSILSFTDQKQGAEGLMITGDDVTLEDFAIEDSKGDAIKANECRNLIIKNVRVEWTNGPDTDNGAYGLYPVQCENVLIDGSVAIGASDAGIYVGQSNNIIVKNSRAEYNVAGIEIENSTRADVFDNLATNNTGGILVFNMPNLPKPGAGTRIFQNKVFRNNTANFAVPGSAVSSVPAGSGIMINSNDQVEIFDNDISDNATANIVISSFFSTGYSDRSTTAEFDPYPEAIYIYGNRFSGGGDSPDRIELKALRVAMYGLSGSLPDIIWDGAVNPALLVAGKLPADKAICVDNGDAVLLNVDLMNNSENVTDNMDGHQCQLPKLEEVQLDIASQ